MSTHFYSCFFEANQQRRASKTDFTRFGLEVGNRGSDMDYLIMESFETVNGASSLTAVKATGL